MSASEIADVVAACPGVHEATVYGVTVPGTDGRAGMTAIVPAGDFDLAALHSHLAARLPKYARPLFLRLRHAMVVTSTFKPKKQDLTQDGFDPNRAGVDALFVDDPETGMFEPIDVARYAWILSGRMRL